MEPTVHGARTPPGLAAAPAQDPELGQRKTRNTTQLRSDFVLKPGRGNGIFRCGDGAPKIATTLRKTIRHRPRHRCDDLAFCPIISEGSLVILRKRLPLHQGEM